MSDHYGTKIMGCEYAYSHPDGVRLEVHKKQRLTVECTFNTYGGGWYYETGIYTKGDIPQFVYQPGIRPNIIQVAHNQDEEANDDKWEIVSKNKTKKMYLFAFAASTPPPASSFSVGEITSQNYENIWWHVGPGEWKRYDRHFIKDLIDEIANEDIDIVKMIESEGLSILPKAAAILLGPFLNKNISDAEIDRYKCNIVSGMRINNADWQKNYWIARDYNKLSGGDLSNAIRLGLNYPEIIDARDPNAEARRTKAIVLTAQWSNYSA